MSDLFSATSLSKGYWYSLFDSDDTSFSLSQLFGVSADELLDVFKIIINTEYAPYSVVIHARSAGVQMWHDVKYTVHHNVESY